MRSTSFSPGFIWAVGVGGIVTSSYPLKCFLMVPCGRAVAARELSPWPDPIKSSNGLFLSLASSKEEKLAADMSLSTPYSAPRLLRFSSFRRSLSICFSDSVWTVTYKRRKNDILTDILYFDKQFSDIESNIPESHSWAYVIEKLEPFCQISVPTIHDE